MNERIAQCPTCFEWVALFVDEGDHGKMIQDCEVCCRPMELTVYWTEEGELRVDVVSAS
jgi:hypothetical protein